MPQIPSENSLMQKIASIFFFQFYFLSFLFISTGSDSHPIRMIRFSLSVQPFLGIISQMRSDWPAHCGLTDIFLKAGLSCAYTFYFYQSSLIIDIYVQFDVSFAFFLFSVVKHCNYYCHYLAGLPILEGGDIIEHLIDGILCTNLILLSLNLFFLQRWWISSKFKLLEFYVEL